jgi:hypothetical protein
MEKTTPYFFGQVKSTPDIPEYRDFRDAVARVLTLYGYNVVNDDIRSIPGHKRYKTMRRYPNVPLTSSGISACARDLLAPLMLTLQLQGVSDPYENRLHLLYMVDFRTTPGCSLSTGFTLAPEQVVHVNGDSIKAAAYKRWRDEGIVDEEGNLTPEKGGAYLQEWLIAKLQDREGRLKVEKACVLGQQN